MRLLWLIFLFNPASMLAQSFPRDAASGKIYYAEEVLVKDGPKSDLYNRAKAWFAAGKNKKALQVDDAANGLLIGRHYSLLLVYDGNKNEPLKLWCTVKLELEDDRYWYSVTDLEIQVVPLSKGPDAEGARKKKQPLEAYVFSKSAMVQKGKEKQYNKLVADAALKSILALINDVKANML